MSDSPKTERLKIWLTFYLVTCLTVLAVIVGMGHVKEEDSFGLGILFGSLSSLAIAAGNSVYQNYKAPEKSDGKANTDI